MPKARRGGSYAPEETEPTENTLFCAICKAEKGDKVDCLLGGIEMALRFQNVEGDDESVELAKVLKEKNATDATKHLTGLEENHPLFPKVKEVVEKVQKDAK